MPWSSQAHSVYMGRLRPRGRWRNRGQNWSSSSQHHVALAFSARHSGPSTLRPPQPAAHLPVRRERWGLPSYPHRAPEAPGHHSRSLLQMKLSCSCRSCPQSTWHILPVMAQPEFRGPGGLCVHGGWGHCPHSAGHSAWSSLNLNNRTYLQGLHLPVQQALNVPRHLLHQLLRLILLHLKQIPVVFVDLERSRSLG